MSEDGAKKKLDQGVYDQLDKVIHDINNIIMLANLRRTCKALDIPLTIDGEKQ